VLKSIGAYLVDLHGPHDHQGLLSVDRQLSMLDAYAGASKAADEYRVAWRTWRDHCEALRVFQEAGMLGERESDLLRHQLDEINVAAPNPDEEAELAAQYQRASNSSHLMELVAGAVSMLSGSEDALLDRMGQLQRTCRDLEKLDPDLRETLEGVDKATMELQEMELSLTDYMEDLDTDPETLAKLEERINVLETLKRKYGSTLEDVLEYRDEVAQRLGAMENRAEQLEALEQAGSVSRRALDAAGETLGDLRWKAAPRLARDISRHLKELGFKQAAFEVVLTATPSPEISGMERVEFEFGPNPGEPLKPLRQIGSSGEISRVMLSVKSALAQQDSTPLMVFDEIDANVGGEIARAVGEKMARLGENHQVVAITHFPQVAAVAKHHFVVSKEVVEGRTCSKLIEVRGEQRVEEMIRMLGGGGDEVRAMAESLLS
jgi:DNA repair protein RecN (Recombination protein N)